MSSDLTESLQKILQPSITKNQLEYVYNFDVEIHPSDMKFLFSYCHMIYEVKPFDAELSMFWFMMVAYWFTNI